MTEIANIKGSRLDEQKKGSCCVITSIYGSPRLLERLISIGLTEETRLTVLMNNRVQPVLLYARDTTIALERREARKIKVRKLE